MVFLLAIAGYAVVLVVGIRYVIRTVIIVLRKAGYIASDFVTEVVETVKSEIPLVEADIAEDIDFTAMKNKLSKQLQDDKDKLKEESAANVDPEPDVVKPKTTKKPVVIDKPVKEVEVITTEEVEIPKVESEKSAKKKIGDIFDQ